MAETIIWSIVTFGCGLLFYFIGVFACRKDKPMWFYAGSEVDSSQITNVKKYNKANGLMWKLYSLWYFASGFAHIWNAMLAIIILVLSCTIGIVILVKTYNKIYNKYKV